MNLHDAERVEEQFRKELSRKVFDSIEELYHVFSVESDECESYWNDIKRYYNLILEDENKTNTMKTHKDFSLAAHKVKGILPKYKSEYFIDKLSALMLHKQMPIVQNRMSQQRKEDTAKRNRNRNKTK